MEQKKTYRVSGELVCEAGTGPFLTIFGALGRVTRVTRVIIHSPVLTAAQLLRIAIRKHSSAFASGTSTAPTIVPLDANGAPPLSVVRAYTVGSTVTGGTLVGSISERKVIAQSTTLVPQAALDEGNFDYKLGEDTTQYPTLRGTAQGLSVHFPVAPASAVTISYTIEFAEDGN